MANVVNEKNKNQPANKSNPNFRTPFGTPLKLQPLTARNIPSFVEQAIVHLTQHGLQLEGIFRISAHPTSLQKLRGALESGEKTTFTAEDEPIVVAALLKMYFRELPDSLLTYELYDCFMTAMGGSIPDEFRAAQVIKTLDMLPPVNLRVLLYISAFMQKVIQNSDVTKMTPSNLSIVFAPNVLRPQVETLDRIVADATKVQMVMTMLFGDFDKIFQKYQDETFRNFWLLNPGNFVPKAKKDPLDPRCLECTQKAGLDPAEKVECMAYAGSDLLWVGSREGTLFVFDTKGGRRLGRLANAHSALIHSMTAVDMGIKGEVTIWTGGDDKKIKIWKEKRFGKKNSLITLAKAEDNSRKPAFLVYDDTTNFIFFYPNERKDNYLEDPIPMASIHLESENPLKISSGKKVFTLIFTNDSDRAEWADMIKSINEAIKQNGKLGISLLHEIDCSAHGKVNAMMFYKDVVLIGFISSTVQVYDAKTFAHKQEISLANPKLDEKSSCVMDMIEHQGNLWIAMTNLIIQVAPEPDSLFKTLKPNWNNVIELPRTVVAMVSADDEIWTATDRHLSVWNPNQPKQCVFQIAPDEKIFTLVSMKDTVLISGWNASLQVWDKKEHKLISKQPSKQEFGVRAMIATQQDPAIQIWTGSYDKTIALWS